ELRIDGDVPIEFNGNDQQNAGDVERYGSRGERQADQPPPVMPATREIPEDRQRHGDQQNLLQTVMREPPEPVGTTERLDVEFADERRRNQHREGTGGRFLGVMAIPPAKP